MPAEPFDLSGIPGHESGEAFRGPCPCGSRLTYERCCQTAHDGQAPEVAEALMRSRYTAYVLGSQDYLLATWHPRRARRRFRRKLATALAWAEILRSEMLASGSAIVEFVARYKASGRAFTICARQAASCGRLGVGITSMAIYRREAKHTALAWQSPAGKSSSE